MTEILGNRPSYRSRSKDLGYTNLTERPNPLASMASRNQFYSEVEQLSSRVQSQLLTGKIRG